MLSIPSWIQKPAYIGVYVKYLSLLFCGDSREITPRSLIYISICWQPLQNNTMPYSMNSILIIMSHLGVKCFNHYRGCSNSSGHNEINEARKVLQMEPYVMLGLIRRRKYLVTVQHILEGLSITVAWLFIIVIHCFEKFIFHLGNQNPGTYLIQDAANSYYPRAIFRMPKVSGRFL